MRQTIHKPQSNSATSLSPKLSVRLAVNGIERQLSVRPWTTLLDTLRDDDRVTRSHRYPAVRAHLLDLQGDADAAKELYLAAAKLATNTSEQRYLRNRAAHRTVSG